MLHIQYIFSTKLPFKRVSISVLYDSTLPHIFRKESFTSLQKAKVKFFKSHFSIIEKGFHNEYGHKKCEAYPLRKQIVEFWFGLVHWYYLTYIMYQTKPEINNLLPKRISYLFGQCRPLQQGPCLKDLIYMPLGSRLLFSGLVQYIGTT